MTFRPAVLVKVLPLSTSEAAASPRFVSSVLTAIGVIYRNIISERARHPI